MVWMHVCAVHCLILHVSVRMCSPAALVLYLTELKPEDTLFNSQPKASWLFNDEYLPLRSFYLFVILHNGSHAGGVLRR